jgi:hypothetical protein
MELYYNGQRKYSRYDTPTSAWESQLDAKRRGSSVADRKFHANSHDSPSTNGRTSVWNKKVDTRSPDTQYLDHMRYVSPDSARQRRGASVGTQLSLTNDGNLSPAASSRLATRRESNHRRNSIKSYESLLKEQAQLNKRMEDGPIMIQDKTKEGIRLEVKGEEEKNNSFTTTSYSSSSSNSISQATSQATSQESCQENENDIIRLQNDVQKAMNIAANAIQQAEKKSNELLIEREKIRSLRERNINTISELRKELSNVKKLLNSSNVKLMDTKTKYIELSEQSKRDQIYINTLTGVMAKMKAKAALPSPEPKQIEIGVNNPQPSELKGETPTAIDTKSVDTNNAPPPTTTTITTTTTTTATTTLQPPTPPPTASTTTPTKKLMTGIDSISKTVPIQSSSVCASIDEATIEAAVNAARARAGILPKPSKFVQSPTPSNKSSPEKLLQSATITFSNGNSPTGTTSKKSLQKTIPTISADMERRFQIAFRLAHQAEKESDIKVRESPISSSSSTTTSSQKLTTESTSLFNIETTSNGSTSTISPSPKSPTSERVVNHQRIRNRIRAKMKADLPRLGRGPRIKGTEGKSQGSHSQRFIATDRLNHSGCRKYLSSPHQSNVVFG